MYHELYLKLFREVTKAVDELQSRNYGRAEELLISAQQATEEMYMEDDGKDTQCVP